MLQGSLLSRLLCLLHVNPLKIVVPSDVKVLRFAAGVSLAIYPPKLQYKERTAGWSREHKLTLNAEKREVSFFTTNLREIQWQPTIYL